MTSDKTAQKRRGPASMSDDHKAALAVGRNQARAVKAYLEAVSSTKPRRGRKRTAESIHKRLAALGAEIASAAPLQQLQLVQLRMDLEAELEAMEATVDLEALEKDFVAVAAEYGDRKGISYSAWRAVGVDPSILDKAGITR